MSESSRGDQAPTVAEATDFKAEPPAGINPIETITRHLEGSSRHNLEQMRALNAARGIGRRIGAQ